MGSNPTIIFFKNIQNVLEQIRLTQFIHMANPKNYLKPLIKYIVYSSVAEPITIYEIITI